VRTEIASPGGLSIIVDASIAAKLLANEVDSGAATRLFAEDRPLLAPDFMPIEVASAWWKKIRRGEMRLTQAEQALADLVSSRIELRPSIVLLHGALQLATNIGHSVYDCLYLALAVEHRAVLASADRRLRQVATTMGLGLWE